MLSAAALIAGLALAMPETMSPRLSADLDGDGTADVVTASATHGAVSLKVQSGKHAVTAKAPAPSEDVVRVSLTEAPLGAVGSLLEVGASTDASECLSVWRYKDGALTRLPIRGAGGRELPDCAARAGGASGGGEWTHRWERPAADAPSVLVREQTAKAAHGTLRRRETYAFAGFSLDLDPARSGTDVDGIPIPAWYDARYYAQAGLKQLYERFDLASFRAMPSLTIEADRDKGIFNLRFRTGSSELIAPVESFSSVRAQGTASLVARAGEKTVHADVRLGGDGNVPYEVTVDGLGAELDQTYGPAGSWEGRARRVFTSAADEIAAEYFDADWNTPSGGKVTTGPDGSPPYRVRVEERVFTLDLDHPQKGVEIALLPTDGSRRGWGITLAGPNAIVRTPMSCESAGDGSSCRPDGPTERLRRIGARINVR